MNIQKLIKNNNPLIMGVLNVTPDSFSDGGKFFKTDRAVKHVIKMIDEGADIIDLGGESSRPGSKPVSYTTEIKRVLPVIEKIKKYKKNIIISLDTYKPEVAIAGLDSKVDIINDITGFKNKDMRTIVAKYKCPIIMMHMKGQPHNMQKNPIYKNCVKEINLFFEKQINLCLRDGIIKNKIILDPGIGFGKKLKHNLEVLNNLNKFKKHKLPILIGASKKSFINDICNIKNPNQRLSGTLITHIHSILNGANILRVHDVAEHKQAIAVANQLKFLS